MFNRKKIKELEKKISSLETNVKQLDTMSASMFGFVFESAREKYSGKYFFVKRRRYLWNYEYTEKSYIRVNSVDFGGNKIHLQCSIVVFSDLDKSWTMYDDKYSLSFLRSEITEKEFQDAYTEYAIAKGLLPKEDVSKKENNNHPKK